MAEIIGYFAVEQGICENVVSGNGEDIFEENW